MDQTPAGLLLKNHLQTFFTLDITRAGLWLDRVTKPIDTPEEPFECDGAERHHKSTQSEKTNAARRGQSLEDGIRVPIRVSNVGRARDYTYQPL
jgi:hypothetical protein